MKCDMCQRNIKADTAVFSRIEKKHYCGPGDWDRCNRIYWKRKREQEKREASA